MLIAIDPGKTSGWALFKEDCLVRCGLATAPLAFDAATDAIIERPVIYPGGRTKNPNDVLSVAVSAGEWGGVLSASGARIEYVTPSGWKGSVRKDISHRRILAKLEAEELAVLERAGKGMAASKRHNMLDAIGIGLWRVGR